MRLAHVNRGRQAAVDGATVAADTAVVAKAVSAEGISKERAFLARLVATALCRRARCRLLQTAPRRSEAATTASRFGRKFGQGWIRTSEGVKPADLQSAPFGHFGTYPLLVPRKLSALI